jgi:GNAT superfamily N-acetyltransferase
MEVRALSGDEIAARLGDLARLRITVFADYPYLYDGDEEYETSYLAEFAAAPEAVLVAAFDGDQVVGAATASPMWAQKPAFRAPFEERGIDTNRLFYFGESVLLPKYRGHGIGHAFFDQREEAAKADGANAACFGAVIREEDDPERPSWYRPLDGFWRKRGYEKVPGLISFLSWKQHGEPEERENRLQYWMRTW